VTYVATVLADTPLHFWRMADPGGGLCHDIGSAPFHMHVASGAGLTAPLGYTGPNSDGGSVDLSASGAFANTGETLTYVTGAITVELLAWPWQFKSVGNQWLFWNLVAGQISLYNDGAHWFFLYNSTFVPAVGVAVPQNQQWTHLVGTYDGVNGQLYVNGAASGAARAIAPQATGSALLDLLHNTTAGSRGFVAEVAVYNTALSAARVLAHYNAIDQLVNVPVFSLTGGASYPSPTPGTSPTDLDTASILSSVRKTY
jgi:hypothetical protein